MSSFTFDSNLPPMIYGYSHILAHFEKLWSYVRYNNFREGSYIRCKFHEGSPWHKINRFWLAAGQVGWTFREGSSSGPCKCISTLWGSLTRCHWPNKLQVPGSGTSIWQYLKWKAAKHSWRWLLSQTDWV